MGALHSFSPLQIPELWARRLNEFSGRMFQLRPDLRNRGGVPFAADPRFVLLWAEVLIEYEY